MIPQKTAFYVRVSRASQDFPSQLHALGEFVRRQGWPLPPKARIFCEKIAGKVAKRTQLDRLLQSCRDGHVDTIVSYRVDRMGNDALMLYNLIAELDRLKVRLVGVADSIDTAEKSATTTMWRGMLITWAHGQRELTVERTVAGLKAARARGRLGGRPPRDPAKTRQILKLRRTTKLSLRAIAKKLGFSAGYVCQVAAGKRFTGHHGGTASANARLK